MDDTRSRIRRQRSLSPTRGIAAETNPLTGQQQQQQQHKRPSALFAIGSFLVPSMFQIKVHDKSATAKKKFQVNVPTKMLVILGLVFFLMPVSVFYYKEKHIHEDHDEAHFKQRKFVNVDAKQALAHFKENQNETSDMTSRDDPPEKESEGGSNTTDTTEVQSTAENAQNETLVTIEGEDR